MRVLVSGSTGLVGQVVCVQLKEAGHTVIPLVRKSSEASGDGISWDPAKGILAGEDLTEIDAIVHLAGEPIAAGRWNAERKTRIRESRVKGTSLLAERIAANGGKPPVLISASAMGYYGDRGDEVLTEESTSGDGFLAEVCRAWESATDPASDAGARVVNLRIGMVLSPNGGALAKMLTPFRLGMGGPLGDGAMWMSWIHIDDLARAILFALEQSDLRGPVNGFAPNPVTNNVFTRTLGGVLRRPAVIPAPAFVLRTALGEMADELLLASVRGVPARLEAAGFRFDYPDLEPALHDLLS